MSNFLSFKMLYSRPLSFRYRSIAESITRRHSGSYSVPSLFRISAKKDCRTLSSSSSGISSNVLVTPLTFRQASNLFIHVTVDLVVFLFLFLSLSHFKSVSVDTTKALVEEVWSTVWLEHVLMHEISEALTTLLLLPLFVVSRCLFVVSRCLFVVSRCLFVVCS